jgi:hypothetical protein
MASESVNVEEDLSYFLPADVLDSWSSHVSSLYSEETIKQPDSDQDSALRWPLSLVEFLTFADSLREDASSKEDVIVPKCVGKTIPRPHLSPDSNNIASLFSDATVADALSLFWMFPPAQHEAESAVAASKEIIQVQVNSNSSDEQVYLVDSRFVSNIILFEYKLYLYLLAILFLFIYISRWWTAWCKYTSVTAQYEESTALVLALRIETTTTSSNHRRPGCIDNSRLLVIIIIFILMMF